MAQLGIRLSVFILLGALQFSLFADTFKVSSVKVTSGTLNEETRPQRGMLMSEVRKRFGNPIKEFAPVGKDTKRPLHHAITRWVYDDYTVVFAEKRVVDTVTLKFKK